MSNAHITKNVKLLSVAFLLIFFGFDGIEQYVMTYFDAAGVKSVGFASLLIIYIVFAFSNQSAAVIVSYLGAKRSMLAAVSFYTLYGLSLLTANAIIIYLIAVVRERIAAEIR